jgi:hypothetical protein
VILLDAGVIVRSISCSDGTFYIELMTPLKTYAFDDVTAEYLGISLQSYREDLKKYGAVLGADGMYFPTEAHIEKAITEYIEPRLIMMVVSGQVSEALRR